MNRDNSNPTLLASEMSIRAIILPSSKLYAARRDRPIADDENGNLSDKRIKARFEALSEDI